MTSQGPFFTLTNTSPRILTKKIKKPSKKPVVKAEPPPFIVPIAEPQPPPPPPSPPTGEVWKKTGCNRFKIITKDGLARFGGMYNVCPQESPVMKTITVFETISNATIKKSEGAKRNQQKICRADDKVNIIGECDAGDNSEVFIFKGNNPLYKRKWRDIKGRLGNVQASTKTLSVLAYGYFRKEDLCFLVKVHDGENSEVWISEKWWRKRNADTSYVLDEPLDNPSDELPGYELYVF